MKFQRKGRESHALYSLPSTVSFIFISFPSIRQRGPQQNETARTFYSYSLTVQKYRKLRVKFFLLHKIRQFLYLNIHISVKQTGNLFAD